ncbi:C40 family peptidase [Lederbergia wuyishanensis]|uniref:Cell wall-associated NlpC family hydrolase n=2 Tax=Lederbergia wuyishanensis TaxID=1347903 RepID=A0ABU0D798_9BACI|nr:C40 family peptidase [Lederbergia wuyishanensis]MCJ8008959.1 C40 family peptidase [Lederbergia wuyishanensis]MDQ0344288.1 cell wall-associated NlpC family hydrolase [Lederbergia wuyishanensis]
MEMGMSVRKTSWVVAVITALALMFSSLFGLSADAAAQTKGDQVAAYAQTLKGKPFKWGGTTTKGFDASGFTQYVYAKSVKVNLPRTSADQFKKGKDVKLKDLKPGDLVFYKTNGKSVSFVGIYVGKQQFIGATSNGVKIQSMNLTYWKTKYVGAKRIVN